MTSRAGPARHLAGSVVSSLVGSVVAVDTGSPHVVLTYDDGPTPGDTDEVLAALAEFGATATFFVLVNRARRRPRLLGQIRDAGHEIALHGPDHVRLTQLSSREVRRRTTAARRELEDLSQGAVRWFRPPYGHQRVPTWLAVRSCGLEPVLWSAGLYDWKAASHEARLTHAFPGLRAGAIVLGHDGFAGHEDGVDDGPAPMVDRRRLTRDVLTRAADLGLRSVSLGAALADGSPVRRSWFRG